MKSFLSALRIVLVYFIFSLMWILFSDALLEYFVQDMTKLMKIQTYKGVFFILVTSLLLFILIRSKIMEILTIQKRLAENEQRLQNVIKGANLGYWDWNYVTNEHLVNDKWLEFLGLSREDIKNNVTDWSALIHPEDKVLAQQAIEKAMLDFQPYVIEFRMRHRDGHWIWIEGSGAVVEKDEKTNKPLRLAGTHKNISFRKKAAEEMSFLALNDALTKLPNRIFLKTKLEEFLQIPSQNLAFLFLDLDYFKNINDVYGHTFGDKVIQDVALRFKEAIGAHDFIARVGGDEFVILTPEVLHVEQLCKALASSIEKPFCIENETFSLGASIGIAVFPENGKTFEALFKNADTAMYVAKNSGKNRFKYYTQTMSDAVFESTKMDSEMKKGIENDEFVLHYQPQVDLATGLVIGVEALVRWQNPFKGFIPPNDFIPRAEENRLIIPLGAIIFKKALLQVKAWRKEGVFDGVMAINISGVQIEEDDFVTMLETMIKEEGMDTHNIELEITESAIMKNANQSVITLQKLKKLGFSIAIDDFGTGYSSLSYLKALPIDKLKIDRSFVKDLPHDKDDVAISKVIIALAKNLELEVLAEGIETKEQKEFLLQNGCHSAQGYLFAKPMDAESFEAFIHQN